MRLLTGLLFALSVSASPILISGGGTFAGSTPSSTFSAANQTWSFSFLVDSNPSVLNVTTGSSFDVSFSNFSYFLNGSSVVISPANIRFFNTAFSGMFNVCFAPPCPGTSSPTNGFEFIGPQMFTGSESTPLMSTGSFTSTSFSVFVNSAAALQSNTTIQAVGSGVPEPSTWLTLGAGLLALAGRRLYRLG